MLRLIIIASCLILFQGCASSRYQHDTDFTPAPITDIQAIEDPVPVSEPLSSVGNPTTYRVLGKKYAVMEDATGFSETGIASWYGMKFHGHDTSNGEIFDVYKMTAAHKTLPLPSYVRVTRTDTGKSIIVRVNDRGPFHDKRIIDLSYAAAVKLDMHKSGTAPVQIEVLKAPLTESVLWVQVGALSNLSNAQRLKKKLENIKTETANTDWTVGIHSTKKKEQSTHRVRIGPITKSSLVALLSILEENGITQTIVLAQHQLES